MSKPQELYIEARSLDDSVPSPLFIKVLVDQDFRDQLKIAQKAIADHGFTEVRYDASNIEFWNSPEYENEERLCAHELVITEHDVFCFRALTRDSDAGIKSIDMPIVPIIDPNQTPVIYADDETDIRQALEEQGILEPMSEAS